MKGSYGESMADVHPSKARHYNMTQIRSKDTKPEVMVRKFLFSKGLRFRKNDKRYPGCPDIVFPKYKTIVFVNGCFWHSHSNCRESSIPETNREYWEPKLKRTQERDKNNIYSLEKNGWNVIVVWECELKKAVRDERLARLYDEIKRF
jgi:DNA mismatch endonuclease (patch repair protein)